jgi:DNA-binding Xre family transcriptional regulator
MSIIYDKSEIAAMSPITQKLDALLKAEGFSLLEAGRTTGINNTAVNRLSYMDGKGEAVFFYTREPGKASA